MRMKLIIPAMAVFVLAGCQSMGSTSPHKKEIESTVREFVRGGDKRDLAMLENALHPGFRAVFTFGKSGKFTILSRGQYLNLIKAGKIGGVPRVVSIDAVENHGNIATVRARLTSSALSFNARYSLVREASTWKLVQDQVVAAKTAPN